jgi:hypothetical protein
MGGSEFYELCCCIQLVKPSGSNILHDTAVKSFIRPVLCLLLTVRWDWTIVFSNTNLDLNNAETLKRVKSLWGLDILSTDILPTAILSMNHLVDSCFIKSTAISPTGLQSSHLQVNSHLIYRSTVITSTGQQSSHLQSSHLLLSG